MHRVFRAIGRFVHDPIPSVLVAFLWMATTPLAAAAQALVERPGQRDFIVDRAGLIAEDDEKRIRELCADLLDQNGSPIVVCTVESMAKYGGGDLSIEVFARTLFDQWRIGHRQIGGRPSNTGILLLVARDDRKLRIELGGGWGHDADERAMVIVRQVLVPGMKEARASAAIVEAVRSLEQMTREMRPLERGSFSLSGTEVLLWVGVAAFLFLSILSISRSGRSGWGWTAWTLLIGIVLAIIALLLAEQRKKGAGGSGSTEAFGDGTSGGGGATGEW